MIRKALFFAVILFAFSCKKKFDEFYERPSTLEPPVYQQLQARGNFTKFLSLIDKAGYAQTLSSAGYWTVLAPTDSAFAADTDFQAYLAGKGISSLDKIDNATAQALVQYLLIYNGFNQDRIDDYQSNTGWIENQAFKRRTAYYNLYYNDTTTTGQALIAVGSNRNNNGLANSYYNSLDNNNKHIPYFTNDFLTAKGLSTSDYSAFFPNASFSGFNIANAKVTQKNIAAENGVIHIIDHVVTPIMNLEEYLKSKPEYSEFRNLLNKYMVQFVQNPDATHRYQVLTGKSDNVFIKVYSNLLAFSPNNENYLKLQDNDAQQNGWTMMVPKNDSLRAYIDRIAAEGYGKVDNFPISVIADLINSHMWTSMVWPSKFNNSFNFLGEQPHMNATTDVAERKLLSNGAFYGTNRVNEPNVFSSVYGKAYLNPKYTLMTRLLNENSGELKNIITNVGTKYTIFMMSDDVLAAQGYGYDGSFGAWTYKGVRADSNRTNLLRILNNSIVETPNNELAKFNNISTADSGTIVSFGGEYLKWKYNAASRTRLQVITAGSAERNLTVLADSIKQTKNGQVVYVNNLLYFPYVPMGAQLIALGTPAASEYNYFVNYLKNSTAYDAANQVVVGMAGGSFYTVFAPNNAAIKQAIIAGLLPGTVSGTTVTPNFAPTLTADKVLVEKFIQYHVLDKRTISNDGRDNGAFPTLLKNAVGDALYVTIQNSPGVLKVSDVNGRTANMINTQSNVLSNRTLIHLIDNYLKYY